MVQDSGPRKHIPQSAPTYLHARATAKASTMSYGVANTKLLTFGAQATDSGEWVIDELDDLKRRRGITAVATELDKWTTKFKVPYKYTRGFITGYLNVEDKRIGNVVFLNEDEIEKIVEISTTGKGGKFDCADVWSKAITGLADLKPIVRDLNVGDEESLVIL
jgi:hypothetical protein